MSKVALPISLGFWVPFTISSDHILLLSFIIIPVNHYFYVGIGISY